jgi:hypothetical protein
MGDLIDWLLIFAILSLASTWVVLIFSFILVICGLTED